jgi:hypothetical protein
MWKAPANAGVLLFGRPATNRKFFLIQYDMDAWLLVPRKQRT